jgi:hypothetical protein
LNRETSIIYSKGKAWECDKDDLQDQNNDDDKWEEIIFSDSAKNIELHNSQVYLLLQFSSIEEVEHLQHHKCIENDGKMSRIVVSSIESSLVIDVSIDVEKPAAANVSSDDSIPPFVLRVR